MSAVHVFSRDALDREAGPLIERAARRVLKSGHCVRVSWWEIEWDGSTGALSLVGIATCGCQRPVEERETGELLR